jgi:magnesium-transporting ATPase (P-type)
MAFSGTLVTSGRITGVVTATGTADRNRTDRHMVSGVVGVTTPLLRQIDRFGTQLSVVIVRGQRRGLLPRLAASRWKPSMPSWRWSPSPWPPSPRDSRHPDDHAGARSPAHGTAKRHHPAPAGGGDPGPVTVICTDKTGTLTRNEMAASGSFSATERWRAKGAPVRFHGTFLAGGDPHDPSRDPVLERLARTGLLCNEASFSVDGAAAEDSARRLHGDPTDGALVVLGERVGLDPDVERGRHGLASAWFPSSRSGSGWPRRTGTRRRLTRAVLLKGAPERVIPMCRRRQQREGSHEGAPDPEAWRRASSGSPGLGYRLIWHWPRPPSVRERCPGALDPDAMPERVDALGGGRSASPCSGITALMDPPRTEAAEAVASCRSTPGSA